MEHLNTALLKALNGVCGDQVSYRESLHADALLGVTIDGKIGLVFKLQVILGSPTTMGAVWTRPAPRDTSYIQAQLESRMARVCWEKIADIGSVHVEGSVCIVVDNQQVLILHIDKEYTVQKSTHDQKLPSGMHFTVNSDPTFTKAKLQYLDTPHKNVEQLEPKLVSDTVNHCDIMDSSSAVSLTQPENEMLMEKVDESQLESEIITDITPMHTVENLYIAENPIEMASNITSARNLDVDLSSTGNVDAEIENQRKKQKVQNESADECYDREYLGVTEQGEQYNHSLPNLQVGNTIVSTNQIELSHVNESSAAVTMNMQQGQVILVIMPDEAKGQQVVKPSERGFIPVDSLNVLQSSDVTQVSLIQQPVQFNKDKEISTFESLTGFVTLNDVQHGGGSPQLRPASDIPDDDEADDDDDEADPGLAFSDPQSIMVAGSTEARDASSILHMKYDHVEDDSTLHEIPLQDSTGEIHVASDPLQTATRVLDFPLKAEHVLSCEDCGRQFEEESELTSHIYRRACEFMCAHCSIKFSTKQELKEHIRVHMQTLPFSCHLCSNEFATIKLLRVHKQIHKVDKLANIVLSKIIELQGDTLKYQRQCFICSKIFTSYFNLKRHLLQHKTSGIDATSKVFEQVKKGQNHFGNLFYAKVKSLSELAINKLAIPVPKKRNEFKCAICRKGKYSHFNLKRHLEYHFDNRIKHSASKRKRKNYKCDKCDKSFTSASIRDLHYEQIHERGVKVIRTGEKKGNAEEQEVKDKSQNTKRKVKKERHNKDDNETVFTCSKCGREFLCLFRLERHVALHKYHEMRGTSGNSIRKFKCSQCINSYSTKQALSQHVGKIHADVRNDQMHVDEHGYVKDSDNINGENRQKTNLNKDLHKCQYCKRSCINAYNLERHEKLHEKGSSRIRPFRCKYCSKTYALQDNLRLHKLEDHKDAIGVDENVISDEVTDIVNSKRLCLSLICSFCGKKCSTTFNLKRHERRWHSADGTEKHEKSKRGPKLKPNECFICPECHKPYPSPGMLKRHMKVHGC